MTERRKLAAILAADVAGFSRLTGADEDRTLARLRSLRSDLIDPTIAVHNGRVVKRTGDGTLVEFRSVVDAVRCAIEVQNAMIERNAGVPPERRIEFRIGIHVGDVVEESDGDLMGDGVNIAARLEGVAAPGAICLSEDAYRQVKARLDLSVSDLGDTKLKNIADPMRVYSLRVGAEAKAKPVQQADPVAPIGTLQMRDKPSIAVLPFQNMSGDAEQDYFADGISEDIITALSKLPQLFVIARNSSFTFKGRNVNVQEVGRSLGVRYVLEGSVRKSNNRVRITGQLIDATTGGHLWAERFDRELTDIFAVQDDVTQHIVGALALNLTESDKQRLATEHTDNLEAYDSFLRGREQVWLLTKGGNAQGRKLLQSAIELDPTFAPAYAFLACAHNLDYVNRWSPVPSESLEKADKAAIQAVSLDDQYPYAHWARAITNLYMRRHDLAIQEANRTISLDPNLAFGHEVLGTCLHFSGRSEEALACFVRAMALDPYFPDVWLHFYAQAVFQLRRYDEAVGILKRRLDRNPHTDASRVLLAASYGHLGRYDEARTEWQEVFRVNPDYSLDHRRDVLPYKNPHDFELIIEGLRKAGIQQ
jgi:adenylate cyclase